MPLCLYSLYVLKKLESYPICKPHWEVVSIFLKSTLLLRKSSPLPRLQDGIDEQLCGDPECKTHELQLTSFWSWSCLDAVWIPWSSDSAVKNSRSLPKNWVRSTSGLCTSLRTLSRALDKNFFESSLSPASIPRIGVGSSISPHNSRQFDGDFFVTGVVGSASNSWSWHLAVLETSWSGCRPSQSCKFCKSNGESNIPAGVEWEDSISCSSARSYQFG